MKSIFFPIGSVSWRTLASAAICVLSRTTSSLTSPLAQLVASKASAAIFVAASRLFELLNRRSHRAEQRLFFQGHIGFYTPHPQQIGNTGKNGNSYFPCQPELVLGVLDCLEV